MVFKKQLILNKKNLKMINKLIIKENQNQLNI